MPAPPFQLDKQDAWKLFVDLVKFSSAPAIAALTVYVTHLDMSDPRGHILAALGIWLIHALRQFTANGALPEDTPADAAGQLCSKCKERIAAAPPAGATALLP